MDRDDFQAARLGLVRFAFGLAAFAAGHATSQVTPAEPFGGRPFGSSGASGALSAPSPAPQATQPMVVQPGAAPVLVQPGAGPVVVQPQPQAQVPPQPQPQQPAPQAQTPPNTAGPTGRPTSSVNPQTPPPGAPQGVVSPSQNAGNAPRQGASNNDDSAAPPITNVSPPAQVTPPFAANRQPAAVSGASAAPQGQPVRGLPADAPKLVISGSVYSPDPARRMLIVNGQVFREGADLGSGVMLQEVRPESAVLDFRGGRYNVFF